LSAVTADGIEFSRLVFAIKLSISAETGQMPPYLADYIHLVSEGNRRSLRSSSDNIVCGATYAQQLRRQKLWRCRSANLEQSAMCPANTWLQTF